MSQDGDDDDVEAILARINANFDDGEINQVAHQEPVQNVQKQDEEQKDVEIQQIVIVREQPQLDEVQQDPILDILMKMEIRNSLLSEKEIVEHQLDTTALQQLVGSIKEKYDKFQIKISNNQRDIIYRIADIKNQTNKLLNLQSSKESAFSKLKISDIQTRKKNLQLLDIQLYKTKGYVLTMIDRMEVIESKLDSMIGLHYSKSKTKINKDDQQNIM